MVEGYPDPKWTKTRARKMLVIIHIVFGSIGLYTGTLYCFAVEYNSSIVTPTLTKACSYILALAMLVHATTCMFMNTIPYGFRKITVPLYYSATVLCYMNSITLLAVPLDGRQLLNTWGCLNIFVLVRLQLALMRVATDELAHEAYSYAMTTAGLFIFHFAQLSPYFLLPYIGVGFLAWPLGYIQFDFLNANADQVKNIEEKSEKGEMGVDAKADPFAAPSVASSATLDDDNEGVPDFTHPEVRRRSLFVGNNNGPHLHNPNYQSASRDYLAAKQKNESRKVIHPTVEEEEEEEEGYVAPPGEKAPAKSNSKKLRFENSEGISEEGEDNAGQSSSTLGSNPFKPSRKPSKGGGASGRRKSLFL